MQQRRSITPDGTARHLSRPREQFGTAEAAPAASRRGEEAAWIRRIQAGDLAPFGELVRRYQDRIYNTCWRICGHAEDARDLTQDAFLKALDCIGEFGGRSAFYTWLFRVAVNLAISHRRRSRNRMVLSLDGSPDGHDPQQSQALRLSQHVRELRQAQPDELAEQREMQARAVAALDLLDDDFRTVLVLRDMEGFDYEEIAAILEVPRGTIKSRLHRARLALREMLTERDTSSVPRSPA
jgi:RNA polymerase sigma-70 factor (ECF subfamily)